MKIFCSTGGFHNASFLQTAISFSENSIKKIELSAGIYYSGDVIKALELLSDSNEIMLHNYFPPAKDSIVLNLASPDTMTRVRSLNFYKNSIELSAQVGSPFFGVHSGFLVDPKPQHLGHVIQDLPITDRKLAFEIFCNSIWELSEYAKKSGVRLLVENNVLSQANYKSNGQDIFLLSNPEEISFFFDNLKNCVGLLLDVGHLNVSCATLKLDPVQQMQSLSKFTEGYHLSGNSGISDDHNSFELDSWFIPLLDPLVSFATLEIYNESPGSLRRTMSALEEVLK